jgi:signal transduction histidine kinase
MVRIMAKPRTPPLEESRLLDAILSIGSDLELDGVLKRIVAAACELTEATYCALGVLDPTGEAISEFVTHGLSPEQEAQIGDRPTGRGVLGLLLGDARPLRLADISAHPMSVGFPPNHPPMHSFIGVPIKVRGVVFGNLYLTEKRGHGEFSERDEKLLSALAAAAGVAIDSARLHQRLGELALFADRERIARDLHDTVIQRLFAVGLSLQGLCRIVEPPSAAARIEAVVDELDLTIADVRSTIFELETRNQAGAQAEITRALNEARHALGFLPRVTFEGPLDSAAGGEVLKEAVAVVREALSNAARHARATRVEVVVAARGDELEVCVKDDGVGMRPLVASGGHGLPNITARAARLGGTVEVCSEPGEGTTITWRVPL